MVAYSFKKQFAPLVESGQKEQTIRANRKRHAKRGEAIQLYTGMRTKGCRKLVTPDPICQSIVPIRIDDNGIYFRAYCQEVSAWFPFTDKGCEEIAKADGFKDLIDMQIFFEEVHGLPFEGVLIRWGDQKDPWQHD